MYLNLESEMYFKAYWLLRFRVILNFTLFLHKLGKLEGFLTASKGMKAFSLFFLFEKKAVAAKSKGNMVIAFKKRLLFYKMLLSKLYQAKILVVKGKKKRSSVKEVKNKGNFGRKNLVNLKLVGSLVKTK